MRIVLQKVSQASVKVDNKIISEIKKGYLLLVGIGVEDEIEDIEQLSKKVIGLKIFEDENDKFWKKTIKEINGEILSVSQFTLMGRTNKNKPDFHKAQKGEIAKKLYEIFLNNLKLGIGEDKVKDGEFGAMMDVGISNDGPVTFILDSKSK